MASSFQKAKITDESARASLLEGGSDEIERRKRQMDEKNLKEDAIKTTERLSDLLSKMGEQVAQSEQTMDSLTGNKLLSKYERRELTDKILVTIALIFYFAVIYYILQKRVLSKIWFW
ncbi:Sec20 [Ancylostoma caninum]|uniref:Sec20 n=1 Tax=Ancylostoma caninum TaxID=29170 RepID=A0A368H4H2_ANCCA|nr:Sec20 [Ancylostoma caninum]